MNIKRIKKTINILGRDVKIIFHPKEETYNKDLNGITSSSASVGHASFINSTINLLVQEYSEEGWNFDATERTLWHEVGHFAEYYTPSSTKENEWVSTMFEFVQPISVQLTKIMKELRKEVWK